MPKSGTFNSEVDYSSIDYHTIAEMIRTGQLPVPGMKYFRAQVSENRKVFFMDSVGYTSKEKYASDLRSNGYRVRLIVTIDSKFEMKPETFQQGSHAFR